MSLMRDKSIRTPEQIGARIRLKRKEKGLSQSVLAERLGVERKWILRLEAGNSKAELGLVLQTMKALGLNIAFQEARQRSPAQSAEPAQPSELSEVFRRLQRKTAG